MKLKLLLQNIGNTSLKRAENELYEGISELLITLNNNGIVMAVATAKATDYAKIILDYFGISHYFKLILGSEMDGTRSSKAEIITEVLRALDSKGKISSMMVGDHKHDIIGARACKINSVGVLWGYGNITELQSSNATYIINSPKELLDIVL